LLLPRRLAKVKGGVHCARWGPWGGGPPAAKGNRERGDLVAKKAGEGGNGGEIFFTPQKRGQDSRKRNVKEPRGQKNLTRTGHGLNLIPPRERKWEGGGGGEEGNVNGLQLSKHLRTRWRHLHRQLRASCLWKEEKGR